MIYSSRAQPEVKKSRIYKVPKNKGFIFLMGEVSEIWCNAMVNNSHVFNLSNCSVVFRM